MATWKNVPLRFREANRLAGLHGVLIDLEWTACVCQRLLTLLEKPQHDSLLVEALSSAALVRYARCFAKGVRRSLPADIIAHLSTEENKDHNYFVNVRDKHIAHSVNPYEDNCVTTLVPHELPPDWRIKRIGFHQDRVVSLGSTETKRLCSLVKRVTEYVKAQIETEKSLVLDLAKKIPLSTLAELEVVAPAILTDSGARKARKGG